MEDIRALLQAAFADELAEHVAAMRAALSARGAGSAIDLRDLFRRAHSLKGAARAVEQPETERLAHALESELAAIADGTGRLDPATVATIEAAIDAIEDAAGGATGAAEAPGEAPAEAAAEGDEMLRVAARRVERLVRSIHAVAGEAQEQAALGERLAELEAGLLATAGLLDRGDGGEARRRIGGLSAEARRLRIVHDQARSGMDRAIARLEVDGESILLVPAQRLFDGYDRMVRELAVSQGKEAVLQVTGADTTADRRVLQALRDPVLHVLRNAVAHGIEPVSARRAAGKLEQGRVTVRVEAVRGLLMLTIADDGAGLDPAAIERRARACGLIAPGAPAPDVRMLYAMLFEQGFSTTEAIDAVSGRGIGLSVAHDAVGRLGGSVAIESGAEGGTIVTLTAPLATARQTVMLFACGGATYALPVKAVLRVGRLADADLVQGDAAAVIVDDAVMRMTVLADVLGIKHSHDSDAATLHLRTGIILVVDRLLAVRSVIVGDPGEIAADVPLVAGTILLDDGAIALMLVADAITARRPTRPPRPEAPKAAVKADATPRRTVLVVDDSITTRTLERGILEAAGYAVRLSVDGQAGLERLRAEHDAIDLVVADVEMPRLDGFGLLTAIRNDPVLRGIPVVMMTSRNSPDDVERGMTLGANAYVTKQDFDQGALLAVIGQLI